MQLASELRRMHHAMAAGALVAAADADVRQEHQRIFQALALVQGDDLHAARVRFQPQLLGFVVVVGIGDAARQPVDQAMRAERAGVGLLQQFGQLQVVGEAALAIDQGEQALPVRGAQVADQGERAAALPALAPVQRLLLPAAVTLAIVRERGDGGGVFASLTQKRMGLVDNWIRHVTDVADKHEVCLHDAGDLPAQHARLCELNVLEQVVNVCRTTIVR
ncbi:Carbonic anhydrase, partial [Xanthomonas hortorum ATCC 19865]